MTANQEGSKSIQEDGAKALQEQIEIIIEATLDAFRSGGKTAAAEAVFNSRNKDVLTAYRMKCPGEWAILCEKLRGVVDLNQLKRFTRTQQTLRLATEKDATYLPDILENAIGYYIQQMTPDGPVPRQLTNFVVKILRRIKLPDGEEVLETEVTLSENREANKTSTPDK